MINLLVSLIVLLIVLYIVNLIVAQLAFPPGVRNIIFAVLGLVFLIYVFQILGLWQGVGILR
jgi:hypothetical protein